MKIFEPHSKKQHDALFSEHAITVLATGIQFGKTIVGVYWLMMKMFENREVSDNFIITSPTYPIINQSTLPPFLSAMAKYGHYNKKNECFEMTNGGTCWFRTAKNPDSIVGLTNVKAILCDEAGLYPLYFWENIQGRSSFCRAPIMIVTSPYSLNWLYKEIIRPKLKNENNRPDVLLIRATSKENPFFPAAEYDSKQQTMDPRRFSMMYGGEWSKFEGLVYDCFDDNENVCEPFKLPSGTKFYGGVDWGTTAPFVLIIRAITPDGLHFDVSELYKPGLTITDMVMVARQAKTIWGVDRFYCDPSAPGYIEEFNRNGLTAIPANNDIKMGIDTHYELIKTRKYKIFRGTGKHTIDEYETYHYKDEPDITPNKDIKESAPVKQNDHSMDASRYLSVSLVRAHIKKPIKVPYKKLDLDSLSLADKIKRLKRPVRSHGEKFA